MRHVIGRNHGAGKDRNDNAFHLIAALFLRTRPPVGEEGEEVGHADTAVKVEVRRSGLISLPQPMWVVRHSRTLWAWRQP